MAGYLLSVLIIPAYEFEERVHLFTLEFFLNVSSYKKESLSPRAFKRSYAANILEAKEERIDTMI